MDLADALLEWYDRAARDLPWREPDAGPWAVLVSEIMLQQTPVARVLPVYREWLTRWPTPAALAADPPGDAVRMWGKLGYPRRALRLHACARAIEVRHDGAVPSDVDDLLALPGVGDYTARAVAAFAFGQRHAVVDTNVRRVANRLVRGQGASGPLSNSQAVQDRATVEAVLPTEPVRAARFSVAMMELGALICTARAPSCAGCPVAAHCAWRQAGAPAYDGPRAPTQRFTGTDRQVRGLLLDVLRGSPLPVAPPLLDVVWADPVQRARALDALVADGLVERLPDGRFALPGYP